ncbi:hypothetical protein [Inconstantimicrobium mannanitabidum]|uniref:Uncharacterized protein n=1 Tax=Inconstantimicrobium mannanitabidum TaxID=1604901 RepID=A0ACB5RGG2_9CLOT|nr:hypothetical protein [Clostridium sp. TW13]GKX68177.1 hypothetical protein rsdtw13_34350 [Clostridium sp. TW13]
MKRIYNYILFKINTTKIYVFSIILIIYIFALMLFLIRSGNNINVYDYIIDVFSYLSLFYSISVLFSVMIYNIFGKGNFYNYLCIRFKTSREIYIANILSGFVFAIGTVIFAVIVCLLTGSFMSFHNNWSQYSSYIMNSKVNQSYYSEVINNIKANLTPVEYVSILVLFTTLYLFVISMVFNICNLIFKKRVISFIIVIILNMLNMVIKSGGMADISFVSNIYILNAKLSEVTNGIYIISRCMYWIILIFLLYICGLILTKKRECIYGE